MKYTKELYNEAYREALDVSCNPGTLEVFSRMAGEELNCYQFEFLSYLRGTPKSEREAWIKEHIIEPLRLTLEFSNLKHRYKMETKTWDIHIEPDTWMGENIVFLSDGTDPNMLLYSDSEAPKVKDIIESWYTWMSPKIVYEKKTTRFVNIMLHSQRTGFSEATIPLGSKIDIDVKTQYMPDLPDSKIQEKIRSDHGGFLIFNGEPGTGKSTYLKYLMETMTDTNFVILDPNALQGGAEEFKNYLIEKTLNCQNEVCEDPEPCGDESSDTYLGQATVKSHVVPLKSSSVTNSTVFILEDAEKLLLKRSETTNPVNLSNVLNITDGIIGDLVKVKFVCTFNCDLSELDPALLRKGRLLQKYEFPKLSGETLKSLADSLDIPEEKRRSKMSLAEIYGWDTDTGLSDTDKGRIGF